MDIQRASLSRRAKGDSKRVSAHKIRFRVWYRSNWGKNCSGTCTPAPKGVGSTGPGQRQLSSKKNTPQVVEKMIFRTLFGPGGYPETSRESPGTP